MGETKYFFCATELDRAGRVSQLCGQDNRTESWQTLSWSFWDCAWGRYVVGEQSGDVRYKTWTCDLVCFHHRLTSIRGTYSQ